MSINVIISIENATTYTPSITTVTVDGARWLSDAQELRVDQSIPGGGRIVGWLDADLPFAASVTVSYSYLAPGPAGGAVVLTVNGASMDGAPLIGWSDDVTPQHQLPGTETLLHREGDDYFVLLRIAG